MTRISKLPIILRFVLLVLSCTAPETRFQVRKLKRLMHGNVNKGFTDLCLDWIMENAVERVPRDLRNLRACLLCSLVKSFDQFELDGCDNCEWLLGMKNNRDVVFDTTSTNFDGIISVTTPDESWAAKWLRIQNFKPGVYAISVSGKPSPAILRELRTRDIPYKSRDRST